MDIKNKHKMNMKYFFRVSFLIFGIFLFSSCSQEKNQLEPKRTVIAGVVENFSDNAHVLIVNYCNPLSKEQSHAQNLIESNGRFHTEHEYVFAQNLTIRFANKFLNLFVHPGDSIFVSIDADEIPHNFNNAVTFSGDHSRLNKELFLWTNYWYVAFNQHPPQFDYNASPPDFLAGVKRNFDEAQDSVNAYAEKTDMSDFLKRWAYVDHKFITANIIMDYENPETNRWDIFTDPVFDVFDENNFQTMYFQYHLDVCMNALIQTDVEISRMLTEKDYVSVIRLTIEKLFEKAPKGTVRDFMLFKFVKNILEEMPELYDSIPEVKTVFSQDFFNMELEKLSVKNGQSFEVSGTESRLSGVLYMTDDRTEKLPDVRVLNFLMDKYKGKVLFIDVWATWCGPCREEFKVTPNLHNYFKEEDVVFVNLCLDSKIENWKSTIIKNNVEGENYFLDNNASQLFRTEHNLPGYPSYLIIDKKGGIFNPAPRPSNLESAIRKIESCLK